MRALLIFAGTTSCLLIGWGVACSAGSCPICRRDEPERAKTQEPAAAECGVHCLLSTEQRASRRDTFDHAIRPRVREVRELVDGYALRFDADDALILDVAGWIRDERKCCRFLEYQLRAERDEGPIWLEVTGEPAAKQFLADALKLSAAQHPSW